LIAIEGGEGRNLVIDGQHRLQAALDVGIRKVPVLTRPSTSS
jgi:ParB-like chromosome segregation protein Spo0J